MDVKNHSPFMFDSKKLYAVFEFKRKRTNHRERLVKISFIRGTFFYYLVLLIGMGLLGSYFWLILTADIVDVVIKVTFFLSGLILVFSTFALAGAKKRMSRVVFTSISGLSGGVHAFLDIVLFQEGLWGALMFSWMAFGLLLAFAALAWLPETD